MTPASVGASALLPISGPVFPSPSPGAGDVSLRRPPSSPALLVLSKLDAQAYVRLQTTPTAKTDKALRSIETSPASVASGAPSMGPPVLAGFRGFVHPSCAAPMTRLSGPRPRPARGSKG